MSEISLPYGTRVVVNTAKKDDGTFEHIEGVVVGVGSARTNSVFGVMHLIRCTDGFLPNKTYQYDTFTAPLEQIDVIV
jgi:aconitase B